MRSQDQQSAECPLCRQGYLSGTWGQSELRVISVWGEGRTYRLDISVDDPQVVHAVQALRYPCQLLSETIRGSMNGRGRNKWE